MLQLCFPRFNLCCFPDAAETPAVQLNDWRHPSHEKSVRVGQRLVGALACRMSYERPDVSLFGEAARTTNVPLHHVLRVGDTIPTA